VWWRGLRILGDNGPLKVRQPAQYGTTGTAQQDQSQQPGKTAARQNNRKQPASRTNTNSQATAKRMFANQKNVIDNLRVKWYSQRVSERQNQRTN